MLDILKKIFGTKNDREIKRIKEIIARVNEQENHFQKLSDEELKQKTASFKERISRGESLESLIPEVFANVREASKRTLGQRHYDVQLIGGVVLHEGKIAEMKTGEGKTLTATAPVYLNALTGKGVHVITVNDYLAKRDSEWMGRVYANLGLSTGVIIHGLTDEERKASYSCDVTYGTNNEFGFDYLRDNMKTHMSRFVQRGHHFAIVDEVDSILIDEARTPLIISGPAETSSELYVKVNAAIPGLQKDSDYIIDEKSRTIALTEDGIAKLEKRLKIANLYDPAHIDVLHHVQQALKAHFLFKKDVDYVVRDGKVIIVDEFTGRLMPGRRYSDGLHGALEAKERLPIERETQTLATVTFQNYFRMYKKLSGMTGTADTEAVEFKKIYNLDVVVIPSNRTVIRKDQDDGVYRTAREKFVAISEEIAKAKEKNQPVLVGTVSVEKSELLSKLLQKKGVEHEVLNAKNHAREAEIIKNAGQKGSVTISTNMAGRGTDIILGEGVAELGGLYVIGTERHESRRVDNQLRGRSGRQGDAGETRFFLSLEDDLMRIFASDRLSMIMGRLGMKEGEAIVAPMVTRAIERAQKRVEEQNFSSRKHLLEYDDVMNQQRQIIYSRRKMILEGQVNFEFFNPVVLSVADRIIAKHSNSEEKVSKSKDIASQKLDASTNFPAMIAELEAEFHTPLEKLKTSNLAAKSLQQISDECAAELEEIYKKKMSTVPEELRKQVESFIYLQVIDSAWKDHLQAMDTLKDSVSLRSYGQRDPLQEYKKEAFRLFEQMIGRMEDDTILTLLRMSPPTISGVEELQSEEIDEDELNFAHPQAQKPTPTLSSPKESGVAPNSPDSNAKEELIYYGRNPQQGQQARSQQAIQPIQRQEPKVGRNDPCPCGSGKKFKKCHGVNSDSPEGAYS